MAGQVGAKVGGNITYSQTLAVEGGVAPFAWSVASGALPSGMILDGDGIIAGTPDMVQTALFTVQVTDGNSLSSEKSFTLTVRRLGDVNDDGSANVADAILALQVLAGRMAAAEIYPDADVDGDSAIGLPEVLYILQKSAGSGDEIRNSLRENMACRNGTPFHWIDAICTDADCSGSRRSSIPTEPIRLHGNKFRKKAPI